MTNNDYQKPNDRLQKEASKNYENLSEEEKSKKRNKNLSEEQKQKLVECRRNYYLTHSK